MMASSSTSKSKHKKGRNDTEEDKRDREMETRDLTEDVPAIPSRRITRKRTPAPALGSGNPQKARRGRAKAYISREKEIWDLTGDSPRKILSPSSAENRSSISTHEPGHPKKGTTENYVTRSNMERPDVHLPKLAPAESHGKKNLGNTRRLPMRPAVRVARAVPLLPRPKGVPVPALLGNDHFQNYNHSNEHPGANCTYPPPPHRGTYTGRAEDANGNQPNATETTNGNQRASEDITMPAQSIPSAVVQPHQLPNGLVNRITQENQASTSPGALNDPRGTNAQANNFQSNFAQVPNFLSSTPAYIWIWRPQEPNSGPHCSQIDRHSQHPEKNVIPSWAVGRPLCLQLSRTEIGEPFPQLQTPHPKIPREPNSLVQYPCHDRIIDAYARMQLPPFALQKKPKPLDNLTSFVRLCHDGYRMWPCLRLRQIRNRDFLSSCKSRSLLRLISRYLLEHALDQIARHDPSSELDAKWLITPKNLYTKGARDLLQKNDRQQGFSCSCTPQKSRSGRYGFSCTDGACENRAMNIECVPGRCGAGTSCQNVRLQRQQFPFVVLQKFPGKGFGLIAGEIIRPGTMIGEYVGEVLDNRNFEKRMLKYQGEQNFYFMRLTSKLVIDGSRKAGLTRFINHSCDPNCTAEKWNAGKEPHVVIVAKREIKPDEEITFSYQAQIMGSRMRCNCGSANCQGWLNPNAVSEEDISAERKRIIEMKIRLAQSDITLAEEILQKLYPGTQDQK